MGFGKFRQAAQKCARHAEQHDKNLRKKQVAEKVKAQKERHEKITAIQKADGGILVPDMVRITDVYLADVQKRLYFNDDYGDFFIRLADEYNMPQLYNTGMNMKNCYKKWFGDWYGMQRVFDAQTVSLCHNRFCSNCMHLRQATLLKRFTPVFEQLQKTYDLYHCVVTVPNCTGAELKTVVHRFLDMLKQLLRYFRGNAPVGGIDFAQYGYVGAVRCLEIVVNSTDYHPHAHMILVLKKDLPLYKLEINAYSFKDGKAIRKFSEFELLMQKIVYLVYTGQKVTAKAIEDVPLGYSCMVDKVENDSWHEVFKYVTKLTKDENMNTLDYEQFVTMYFALKGKHIMQGYGVLYNVAKDESIDDEVQEEYYKILAKLRSLETPVSLCKELDELVSDSQKGHVRVISKYILQQLLNGEAYNEKNDD